LPFTLWETRDSSPMIAKSSKRLNLVATVAQPSQWGTML
jgi:hypothetical protein